MTDFRKILTDQQLAKGSHGSAEEGTCVMEKVALLWALHEGRDVSAAFSDLPECTNQVIAQAAQRVNDVLDDADRQKLNALIPRLLRARRTESDQRVNVRLALFSARYVLDLVRPEDRGAALGAIEAAEAWLENPTAAAANAANAANAVIAAANAANAAAYAAANAAHAAANAAAYAAAYAANAANAAHAAALAAANAAANAAPAAANAAVDEFDPIRFLDELLDAWEEAVTKEGEDLYVPRAWEDEALAFVSEYMVGAE